MKNRILILTAIIGALATIFTITLSISLLVIENAAQRYSHWVSEIYVHSRKFQLKFGLFMLAISMNLVLIWFKSIWTVPLSSITLLLALIIVYDSIRTMVNFFDDEKVLSKMANETKSIKDGEALRESIRRFREIAIETPTLGTKIIDKIVEICTKSISSDTLGEVEYASAKDQCAAQLKVIGKTFARDEQDPITSLEAIRGLFDIAKDNAIEIKEGTLRKHELYLIRNNIAWSRSIWNSVIDNVTNKSKIEYRELHFLINGFWLIAKELFTTIEDSDSEEFEILKSLSDFMEKIINESEHLSETEINSLNSQMKQHYSELSNRAREKNLTDDVFDEFWNRKKSLD